MGKASRNKRTRSAVSSAKHSRNNRWWYGVTALVLIAGMGLLVYARGSEPAAVGPYILDFYCAPGRLAVEVDGSQHYTSTGLADDALRTLYLRAAGVRVLRFTNVEVLATSRA